MNRTSPLSAILLGAIILMSSACSTTPQSSFYLLTPMLLPAESLATDGKSLSVGVGPIRLPEYLDRPQIVSRQAPNQLHIDEVKRWGGSLEDNMLLVLAQNLSALLATDQVLVYPWDDPLRPDYLVRIELRRFDRGPDAAVELDARWTIEARNELGTGRSLIRQQVTKPEDYTELVQAQSRAMEGLSRDIAKEIHGMAGGAD